MGNEQTVGQHRVWFEEPDVLGWQFNGEVSLDQAKAFSEFNAGYPQSRFLKINLSSGLKLPPEVREFWGKGVNPNPANAPPAEMLTIVFGAALTTRAIANLVISALRVFSNNPKLHVDFVKDEAAADALIREKRGARS